MVTYENCPGGIVRLPVCEEKLEHAPLPLGEPYDHEGYVISGSILYATFDCLRYATFRSILCATSSRLCATISSRLCATFRSRGRRSSMAWGDRRGRLWLGRGIGRFLSEQLQQSVNRRGIHRQVTSEAISS